jgi:hypothetical protein
MNSLSFVSQLSSSSSLPLLALFTSLVAHAVLLFFQRTRKESGGPNPNRAGSTPTPPSAASPLPSPDATLSLIKKRRSIKPKDFAPGEVTREELETLLEAANWAPSHGKTESWR